MLCCTAIATGELCSENAAVTTMQAEKSSVMAPGSSQNTNSGTIKFPVYIQYICNERH